MTQDGLGLVFLLGAGALLLRPGDFPLFARAGGRLVGLTVRSMRVAKDAAEKAIKESADLAHQENPDMVVMRENLKRSLTKFESLTTTVRRDVAGVPLNPSVLLRKGWRSWENMADGPASPTGDINQRKKHEDSKTSTAVLQTMNSSGGSNVSRNTSQLSTHVGGSLPVKCRDQLMSGADVLSAAIEEAALARKEQHFYGKAKQRVKGRYVDGSASSKKGA